MAGIGYLTSALVMGALLVAVATTLAYGRAWHRVDRRATGGGGADGAFSRTRTVAARTSRSPTAWSAAFVAFTFGVGVLTVLFVSGETIPPAVRDVAGVALVFVTLLAFVCYLFYGVYRSVRYRGLASAYAAAVGLWVLGLTFVGAIVLKLLVG